MSIPRILILLVCFLFLGFTGGMIAEDALIAQEQPVPLLTTAELRDRPQDYTLPVKYASEVIYWCDRTGIPVWLVCRLFSKESSASGNPLDGNWRPEAISPAGASGIAQLMPANFVDFSKRYNDGNPIDPHDAETSIRVGILYLADLYATFKDWRRATGAYNAGPYVAPAKWKNETTRYVRAILDE